MDCVMPLSLCFTRMSFRDFPVCNMIWAEALYKDLQLSCGWFCMRCHFLTSNVFKLGKAGWYCVTKGNILPRASLFFCLSDAFLSLNFTPERCFDPANNGQTGYINSTSRKYSYCYQNSQWQLTRFQVESKPQSCLRICIGNSMTCSGIWQ